MASPASKAGLDDRMKDAIVVGVREDEIVAMCCDVINIPSATGNELAMAEYMRSAFQRLGLTVTWQPIEDRRANVIGRLEGSGSGPCLMFNGHMDTPNSGDETFSTGIGYKSHAVVQNGMIYGLGIYNMKGALVCYIHAVKALLEAGVKLDGDVILGAVCGEIEKTQWGEFQGKEFRGYGAGTHYLVKSRRTARICILVSPPTCTCWSTPAPCGCGLASPAIMCTRWRSRRAKKTKTQFGVCTTSWRRHACRFREWQEQPRWAGRPGFANIDAQQVSLARASRTPERADLFLDVRAADHEHDLDARRVAKKLYLGLKEQHPGSMGWSSKPTFPFREQPSTKITRW